jgi:sirohydrochlorin cobaltochelatase
MENTKKALLTVSFGTSYGTEGFRTLEKVSASVRAAFPDRECLDAWTSRVLRKKLLEGAGIEISSVTEALERLRDQGADDVTIQPTHLLRGEEFLRIEQEIVRFADSFSRIALGAPLLSDAEDIRKIAGILQREYPVTEGELLVLMGHGSAVSGFPAYELLQKQFETDGFTGACVGTVEFEPGIGPVLERIRREKPGRVHLAPLLLSAGGHVLNDMSGDGPDSWKNQMIREGAEVICHVRGLGEMEDVRRMYAEHAAKAKPVGREERS